MVETGVEASATGNPFATDRRLHSRQHACRSCAAVHQLAYSAAPSFPTPIPGGASPAESGWRGIAIRRTLCWRHNSERATQPYGENRNNAEPVDIRYLS